MSNEMTVSNFFANTTENPLVIPEGGAQSNTPARISLENVVDPMSLGLSVSKEARQFREALNSGVLLAKSITTNEVKMVNVEPATVLRNVSIGDFEVHDSRVRRRVASK